MHVRVEDIESRYLQIGVARRQFRHCSSRACRVRPCPIQHTMKWSGVLIEASPTNYKALQRNRGGGRAKLINSAVSGFRPL